MPTHKVVTIDPKPEADSETRELILTNGPQFRIPCTEAEFYDDGEYLIVPACALRNNWVGWFFLDKVQVTG